MRSGVRNSEEYTTLLRRGPIAQRTAIRLTAPKQ